MKCKRRWRSNEFAQASRDEPGWDMNRAGVSGATDQVVTKQQGLTTMMRVKKCLKCAWSKEEDGVVSRTGHPCLREPSMLDNDRDDESSWRRQILMSYTDVGRGREQTMTQIVSSQLDGPLSSLRQNGAQGLGRTRWLGLEPCRLLEVVRSLVRVKDRHAGVSRTALTCRTALACRSLQFEASNS